MKTEVQPSILIAIGRISPFVKSSRHFLSPPAYTNVSERWSTLPFLHYHWNVQHESQSSSTLVPNPGGDEVLPAREQRSVRASPVGTGESPPT